MDTPAFLQEEWSKSEDTVQHTKKTKMRWMMMMKNDEIYPWLLNWMENATFFRNYFNEKQR